MGGGGEFRGEEEGGKGGATAEEDIKMKVSRNTRPSIEGKKEWEENGTKEKKELGEKGESLAAESTSRCRQYGGLLCAS